MSGKIMMNKGRFLKAALSGTVLLTALTLWGCGTKGYDDITAARNAALDAAITTTKAPAIIDAATLKGWIDEGKLNAPAGSLDRVALVSVTTLKNYSTASKKHIPGAALFDSSSELYATREEGLGPVGSMVPSGAQIDAVIKKLGIDANTTIVLTIPKASTDSEHYPQSRAYFTFRYWGFDRNRVKILNGGDDAWDIAAAADTTYGPLTKSAPVITPSTYSVAKNKAGLKDVLRYSVTELIARVDALIADSTQLNSWQMIEARGATTTPYITNAFRTKDPTGGTAHAMMFLGDRVNGESTRNRLYPSKADLVTRMATLPLLNGAENAFLSPDKKTIAMCGSAISASPSFVLFDAVLAVPEGQIMLYDGSSSQWNGYSNARIAAANPTATTAQIEAWAFDTRIQGTLPTTGSLATLLSGYALNAPSSGLMNQIETADKAYMAPAAATGTTTSTGGSAGGGC
ncbi:MAG: selenite/tellurite reduction operon rhodanese-like protein ExtH [Desulfuromonadaceae bacterium]|nr:selenite/tellurite reduction operon rhodanese-like protein ExtH [Desulfuromonadaceae bacterium]